MSDAKLAIILGIISLVASVGIPVIRGLFSRPVTRATAHKMEAEAAEAKADALKTINEVIDRQAISIERLKTKVADLEETVKQLVDQAKVKEKLINGLQEDVNYKQGLINQAIEIIHKFLDLLKTKQIDHQIEIPPDLRKGEK